MINISENVVEKSKQAFYVQYLFPKILPFMRYVEKYVTARQATDDTVRRTRYAWWKNIRLQTHTRNM